MVSTAELLARPIALDAWQAVVRSSRVVFGAGRLVELGALVAELGGSRVLLVTDAGVEAAGHVAVAMESLGAASIDTVVFDAGGGEPDHRARRSRSGDRSRAGRRLHRRPRRRQRARLRQGRQLPPHQRRPHRGLPGLEPRRAPDAAVDRRALDRRDRQRGAVLRADRAGGVTPEDGLRRREGAVHRGRFSIRCCRAPRRAR